MAIETEQLEYWGNKFTRHGLERYMTFDAFMRNPRKYWLEIMGGPHLGCAGSKTATPTSHLNTTRTGDKG